jgi:hypothetical protein
VGAEDRLECLVGRLHTEYMSGSGQIISSWS